MDTSSSSFPTANNSGKLAGKIALVTGGNSGIGLATAKRFVAEGADVFITGRRQANLDQAVQEIGPEHTTALQADSSKLADLDRVFAAIREKAGRLDIVFVNAGGGEHVPLGQITEEHYAGTFDRNVKGVLFTVQGALPLLGEGASIIINASVAGSKGIPAFSVYSATKAAVRSFARGWLHDLKGRGIRVNVVSPGPIETPGLTGLVPADQAQGMLQAMAGMVPLGRIGQPEEVAGAVLFLASADSSFVNGAELIVDGGIVQI